MKKEEINIPIFLESMPVNYGLQYYVALPGTSESKHPVWVQIPLGSLRMHLHAAWAQGAAGWVEIIDDKTSICVVKVF